MTPQVTSRDTSTVFDIPVTTYQIDRDFVAAYQRQTALHIRLMRGVDYETALDFVKEKCANDPRFRLKDPDVIVNVMGKNGDRKTVKTTFFKFYGKICSENVRIAPSLTVYHGEEVMLGEHPIFIKGEMENRKKNKKLQLRYDEEGNHYLRDLYGIRQVGNKTDINAYSGGTVNQGTILYCKSTHSSLTSLCRCATSYANANNEKLLGGNRHYYDPLVIRSNLLATIDIIDLEELDYVVKKFGLVYPTPSDVMDMIFYSASMYGSFEGQLNDIEYMVEQMEPIERAAIMYTGDMFHTYKLNPGVIGAMLKELTYVSDDNTDRGHSGLFNELGETEQTTIKMYHYQDVAGRPLKELEPEVFNKLDNTAYRFLATLDKYAELISGIFLTDNLPSSVYDVPNIRRRVVPISDTDSTIFSTEYWVNSITPDVSSAVGRTVTGLAITYLVSGTIMHIMAMLSTAMGVHKDKLRALSMKNEFFYKVLCATPMSKTYYAQQTAKEGIMFKEPRLEIKGVLLKDSKMPKFVTQKCEELIKYVTDTLASDEMVDVPFILKEVADAERKILASLDKGETQYLSFNKVKPKESYARDEEEPNYVLHELWQEVMGPKYGYAPPPEYSAVKLPIAAGSIAQVKKWADQLEDKQLGEAFLTYMSTKGKKGFKNLIMPSQICEEIGIPIELQSLMDKRSAVLLNTKPLHVMITSLHLFVNNEGVNLVSDFY